MYPHTQQPGNSPKELVEREEHKLRKQVIEHARDQLAKNYQYIHAYMQGSLQNTQNFGVPGRESSPELENKDVERKTEGSEGLPEASGVSDLKRQLLQELGLEKYAELAETEENSFDKLLELRIEQKRKEVEVLRDSNLRTLNMIFDKCIESEKISDDVIRRMLNIAELPSRAESASTSSSKRRRLASPAMSPRGHRRFASDAVSINSKDPQQYQAPAQNITSPYPVLYPSGPGPTPWLPQHYNTPMQTQFQFQGPVPAGLGVRTARSREASTYQNNENQISDHLNSFSSGQFIAAGNPSIAGHQSAALTGRAPLMSIQSESPARTASGYLQPPQQVQPQYGMKTEPLPQKRTTSHRRSQSANVPPIASIPHVARSPATELHATPQKPVNFLIHTPKHPPPT